MRSYPGADGSPVFAEIKGRHVDVIRKTRAVLPADGWQDLVQGRGAHGRSRALDDFVYRLHTRTLEPKALIQYRREAWVSTIETYARVSVDASIVCQHPDGWSLEGSGNWRPIDHPLRTWMPSSPAVLELKWADVAPRWMMQLVQTMDLTRHAFSKYCYSMYELAEDHLRGYRRPTGVA